MISDTSELSVDHPPALSVPPRRWPFLGTTLWGLFAFAAMFLGQMSALIFVVLRNGWPGSFAELHDLVASGFALSLSVILGLPAVAGALWIAIRKRRERFADYLALRGAHWGYFVFGAVALMILIFGWDLISRALSRDVAPGFMLDVMKSARSEGILWLLGLAFCVAAPMSEELLVRGFLFRGWSESAIGPIGAIVLSSMVWTAMHLQYNWYFFGQIFSIGLLLGYLRYRSHSTWLTIALHGLNNLAATIQGFLLSNPS